MADAKQKRLALADALGRCSPTETLVIMRQNPADHHYWSRPAAEVQALDLYHMVSSTTAIEALRRIADATPARINAETADRACSWFRAVARTALADLGAAE